MRAARPPHRSDAANPLRPAPRRTAAAAALHSTAEAGSSPRVRVAGSVPALPSTKGGA